MSEYFSRVTLSPMIKNIGRLEGSIKAHRSYRKLMVEHVEKTLRVARSKKRRKKYSIAKLIQNK